MEKRQNKIPTIYIRTDENTKDKYERLKEKKKLSNNKLIKLLLDNYEQNERLENLEKDIKEILFLLSKNDKRKFKDEKILR